MAASNKASVDPYSSQVRDVMAAEIVWIDPQDSLQEALGLLVENKVSALPVVDGTGKCVGVVSATDLLGVENEVEILGVFGTGRLEAIGREDLESQVVKEVMTTPALTVSPTTLLAEAADIMLDKGVHRLVVTDADQSVIGIISTVDILAAFVAGSRR